jgi:hypothetical protein
VFNILAITLVAIMLLGCSTSSTQKIDRETLYEYTLGIEHKEKQYFGVAVFESDGLLELTIRNTRGGELDHVLIDSMHRHDFFQDKGGKWKYRFKYYPHVESGIVKIKGFDDKGRHSYGAFILADGTQKLKANLFCNGEAFIDVSVSACQSKESLLQLIQFKEITFLEQGGQDPACFIKAPGEFQELQFGIAKDWCVYTFTGIDSGKEHKMWTYGHEMNMVPSGK